jgi:hypothetical protein
MSVILTVKCFGLICSCGPDGTLLSLSISGIKCRGNVRTMSLNQSVFTIRKPLMLFVRCFVHPGHCGAESQFLVKCYPKFGVLGNQILETAFLLL